MRFGENVQVFFFSVNYTTDMDRVRYIPQVCYKGAGDLRAAVEKLVRDGLAVIYGEEVRFVSGAAVPVKKSGTRTAPAVTSSSVSPARSGKRGGKGRKDFE